MLIFYMHLFLPWCVKEYVTSSLDLISGIISWRIKDYVPANMLVIGIGCLIACLKTTRVFTQSNGIRQPSTYANRILHHGKVEAMHLKTQGLLCGEYRALFH